MRVERLISVLGQEIRVDVRPGNAVPLVMCNGIEASLECLACWPATHPTSWSRLTR
jgi:hypothetical protein